MAELDVDDVLISLNKSRESYCRLLSKLIKDSMESGNISELPFKSEHYKEVYKRGLSDSRRFFTGDELKRINSVIAEEMSYYDMMAESMLNQCCGADSVSSSCMDDDMADEKFSIVPKRLFRGPIAYTNFEKYLDDRGAKLYSELKAKYVKEPKTEELEVFSMLWCDGKRNLRTIVSHSSVECGAYNPEYVYDYFDFLANIGLMQM